MTTEQEQMLKKQFIDITFRKDWVQKIESRSFNDENLIRYCLDKAWPDAIIYVRKKNTTDDEIILKNAQKIKEEVLDSIINSKWGSNFDAWHDDLCQKDDYGMRYGVWQKYINMCFKYLYCINERLHNSINLDFNKCHIPLDDNTLLWCRNNNITQATAWNSITRDDYLQIRNGIKAYLDKNPDLTSALQLDFIVWRIKKICDVLLSVKRLNDDLNGLENYHMWFADCGYDITDKQKAKDVITEMELLKSFIGT